MLPDIKCLMLNSYIRGQLLSLNVLLFVQANIIYTNAVMSDTYTKYSIWCYVLEEEGNESRSSGSYNMSMHSGFHLQGYS